MLDAFAAGFLVFAYVATALFQIAIVLGAPLGEYAYGGQNPGILKLPFRIGCSKSLSWVAQAVDLHRTIN